jgi:hypothetical protein
MTPRRYKLTLDIQNSITAFIVAGAFPHVAAEAAGIPAEVFHRWMERGNPMNRPPSWKPHRLYTPFWQAVRQASAQARLAAEVQALRQEAVRWLMQGPGKERPRVPGWSQTVRPQITEDNKEINVLLDPQWQSLFATILQVLAPFPEARAALAQALAGNSPRVIEARPREETGR